MLDLVYPIERAPIIGGTAPQSASEMLPVVEPSGLVTGQAPRGVCHSGSLLLHPVVHLHIMDRMERLYIQRRSLSKDLLPGYWDTAVGGHLSYGEYYLEALYREAGEELGLTDFNPFYIKTYVHETDTEKELVGVFAAIGSYELHPDLEEVSEGRWWTESEIAASIGKGVFTPNFEEEYLDVKDSIKALL